MWHIVVSVTQNLKVKVFRNTVDDGITDFGMLTKQFVQQWKSYLQPGRRRRVNKMLSSALEYFP
jgi:hypothetical protein